MPIQKSEVIRADPVQFGMSSNSIQSLIDSTLATEITSYDLGTRQINVVTSGGSSQTIDFSDYAVTKLYLTADCTLSFVVPNSDGMYAHVLYTVQNNGGGHDIILPSGTLFDSGNQPSPVTSVNNISKYVITALNISNVKTYDVTMSADGLAV